MSGAAGFSNPELNPLTNPVLGRNLGRWVEVYLTTPPEEREVAITNLLRELQAEGNGMPSPDRDSAFSGPRPPNTVCPKCGHESLSEGRFCGLCGASLADAGSFLIDSSAPQGPESFAEPSTSFSYASSGRSFAAGPHPGSTAAPDLPSFAPAPGPSPSSTLDVSWMRERNLFGEPHEGKRRRHVKYVLGLLAVLVGVGTFQYFRTATAAKNPALQLPAALPDSAQPKEASPAAAPRESALKPEAPSSSQTVSPMPVRPPAAPSSLPSAGGAPLDDGSAELAVAEDYLEGRKGPRDPTAAAQLLWKAVAKQNNTAILLLSDLYVNGDGVSQSCDQARILLSAAARRNVKAASDRLNDLAGSCR